MPTLAFASRGANRSSNRRRSASCSGEWQGQGSLPLNLVRIHAQSHEAANVLIEDKASGTHLIQELRNEGLHGVTKYVPAMEKILRMHSVTPTIENGLVHLPEKAEWLAVYLHELTTFPSSKFDDQADSTSQALDWIKKGHLVYGLTEYLKREEAKLASNGGVGPYYEVLMPSRYRFP
jgi:predicted phage terminase large subunit-like protein